ncbi:MAG TPA: hypothetical protein VL307_17070 [Chitinophagaceae bacterium]|nr:hypothetical protein [Chitinophagaceae bacterium]
MKSPAKLAILSTPKKNTQKNNYRQAASAIQKKLLEIKQESKQPAAVNNNLSLFRYKV